MVYGLEKFKEYFADYTNQYVFIGGTACDILMDELGVPFRATKDLDIVLIIEALDASFGDEFWQFIEDSIVSLSAILLNDVYYDSLLKSKITVDGYSVIEIETVILFKIKAWIDMKEKLENGEHIDSKNIKKHKNDIFRLLANVLPSSKVEIDKEIEKDINFFIKMIDQDRPDLKNLGIRGVSFNEMIELLESIYL